MMGNDLGSGLQVAADCARSPRSQSSGGGETASHPRRLSLV